MLDTLANVKARLGITTSDDDIFLTTQITLISDVIESYCGRKFLENEYVQTFYSKETPSTHMLELYHFPLISIESVEIDEVAVSDSDYRIHKPTARLISKVGPLIGGDETIVTYTAGYATCPTPILDVLDSIVSERYTKKKAGVDLNFGSDVQRISIPGTISLDFDYSLQSNERKSTYGKILGNYANVLDMWRSERAVVGTVKMSYVEEVP